MKFIAAMKEVGLNFENKETGIRNYHWLATKSGYHLSVQCSKIHYSSPREMLNLECYENFEIAIMDEAGSFAYPAILDDFSRSLDLKSHFDGSIFIFVPKDLVEDLYTFLNGGNL